MGHAKNTEGLLNLLHETNETEKRDKEKERSPDQAKLQSSAQRIKLRSREEPVLCSGRDM